MNPSRVSSSILLYEKNTFTICSVTRSRFGLAGRGIALEHRIAFAASATVAGDIDHRASAGLCATNLSAQLFVWAGLFVRSRILSARSLVRVWISVLRWRVLWQWVLSRRRVLSRRWVLSRWLPRGLPSPWPMVGREGLNAGKTAWETKSRKVSFGSFLFQSSPFKKRQARTYLFSRSTSFSVTSESRRASILCSRSASLTRRAILLLAERLTKSS